jgi:hypothetical protein
MQAMPDLEFSFYDMNLNSTYSSLTFELTLEPEDYMVNVNDNEIDPPEQEFKAGCIGGFVDHGTQYGWNFGIMLLKKFVMVYDFQEDMIGFVRSNDI